MNNLKRAELSMEELQTLSDSQQEDIEIWKGRVKSLEEENAAMKVSAANAWDEWNDLAQENMELEKENKELLESNTELTNDILQLTHDLVSADARGDE